MFGMEYKIGAKLEVSETQSILQIVKEDKEGNVPKSWHEKGLKFLAGDYDSQFTHEELAKKSKSMKKCKHNSDPIILNVEYLFENGQNFTVCPDCNKVLKEDSYESENTQKLVDLKFAEIHMQAVESEFEEIEEDYLFRKEQAQKKLEEAKKLVDDIKNNLN